MITEQDVRLALAEVRDPEVDEPISEMGFVEYVHVRASTVAVGLRLPTYFCAPNFAFMMVEDVTNSVGRLVGNRNVEVVLSGHFASDRLTGAASTGGGFARAFPEEAPGGLDDLRRVFRHKNLAARQAELCAEMRRAGRDLAACTTARLGDLPESALAARCKALREELGLPAGPATPAFVDAGGRPFTPELLERMLRRMRVALVTREGNAQHCRSLLRIRYRLDGAAAKRRMTPEIEEPA